MYTVMVKWKGSQRAERLGHGQTVTRRRDARVFRCKLAAENAARVARLDRPCVERWWVAPF